MYAAFVERVLGYPTEQTTNIDSAAGAGAGVSLPNSGAPAGSTSAQFKAGVRPYHSSQTIPSPHRLGCGGEGRDGERENDLHGDPLWGGGLTRRTSAMAERESRPSSSDRTAVARLAAAIGIVSRPTARPPHPLPGALNFADGARHLPTHSFSAPMSPNGRASTMPVMQFPLGSASASAAVAPTSSPVGSDHLKRLQNAVAADPVDMAALRDLCWQGCPVGLRYEVWMFLTGCWTPQSATRHLTTSRRRSEYASYIHSTYDVVDWDAVCAMADSGLNTAVHRSTLKGRDHSAASFSSIRAPRDVFLPGQVVAATGSTAQSSPSASMGPLNNRSSCHTPSPHDQTNALVQPLQSRLEEAEGRAASYSDSSASAFHDLSASEAASKRLASLAPFAPPLTNFATPPVGDSSAQAPASQPLSCVGSTLVRIEERTEAASSHSFISHPALPSRRSSTSTAIPSSATKPGPTKAAPSPAAGRPLTVSSMLGSKELQTLKQIRKDIPRMSGGHLYLRHPRVQRSIERILFIWSMRYPACGYVQGMNDLVVPFMSVVLGSRFCPTRSVTELHAYTADIFEETWSEDAVSEAQWIDWVEADVYWMTSYLLNTIQDNYTFKHAGITSMIRHLAAVVQAADPLLYHHLVDVLQLRFELFSFRWMNCLLLRELTETQTLRLLDAYLSDEERQWSVTHVYVCAALLLRWGPQLMAFGGDYVSTMRFLQAPPTEQMSLRDLQDALSEAFLLQSLYEASLPHLASTMSTP